MTLAVPLPGPTMSFVLIVVASSIEAHRAQTLPARAHRPGHAPAPVRPCGISFLGGR